MNRREYNTVVDRDAQSIYRFAYSLVGDKEDAQDLVQEAFMKLWQKRDRVTTVTAKSYLFKSVKNKVIDQSRKAKNSNKYLNSLGPAVTTKSSHLDNKDMIRRMLGALNDTDKSILMLRDWDGYNYEEIASILDISLANVKIRLFRARKRARIVLYNLQD